MFVLFILFISTFCLTKMGGKWMFLVWVCVIYFCIGAPAPLFPTFTNQSFGPKYFGVIYGLAFTALVISSLLAAVIFSALLKVIGMSGISLYDQERE